MPADYSPHWARAGRGEAATCKFGTRVDYFYTNQEAASAWRCEQVHHLEAGPSDHRPLLALLRRLGPGPAGGAGERPETGGEMAEEEVDEEVLLLEEEEIKETVVVEKRCWGDLGRAVLEELAREAGSEEPGVGWWAAPQAVLVGLCQARGWPPPSYRVEGGHCTVVVGEGEYGEEVEGGGRELAAISALHRLGRLQ